MTNKLIAYYSRADENYVSGTLKTIEKGNTQIVAETIKEITGADIFKIEQSVPYAKDYNACVEQAKRDQMQNRRPELKKYLESIRGYDVIYLGYPNYWGTMPMAVFTFLERYDFGGKRIIPFCTHEGSGMGKSVSDVKKLCPSAEVGNGLAIYGSRVGRGKEEIARWLKEND